MDTLFGSSPKVVQQPATSTLSAPQQGLLSQLASYFSGVLGNSPTYTQPLTAQLTGAQNSSLNNVNSASSNLSSALPNAVGGLDTATSTLEGVANSTPANFQSYFQNSVVQPLMQSFNTQTIPALQTAFGASAGGTKSSNYGEAVDTATNNLENTIANNTSSTALSEFNTNQTNKLDAAQLLDTNASGAAGLQNTLLTAQALPQTTQQSTYSNAYQEFLNQLSESNTLSSQASGLSTAGTVQQGNSVAESGTSGLLQSLLQGAGGSAIGSGLVSGGESVLGSIPSALAGLAKAA